MRGENIMRKLNIVIAGIMLACIGMSGCGNTQNVSDKTTQPEISIRTISNTTVH